MRRPTLSLTLSVLLGVSPIIPNSTTAAQSNVVQGQVLLQDGRPVTLRLTRNVSSADDTVGTDTTPPTAPTNLKASVISPSQINLTWTASTDNVGVTNYKVFRNNVQVGQNLNPSFNNTGLTANTTYTYYVIAYDAAGNASPKSTSVSATTAGSMTITVSNVAVSNVATSSATIAFTTNVAASADILYGTNGSYNNSDPADAASLNHTHVLTGLTPGTVYNFKISAHASGVQIYTGSYSFSTLSVQPPSIGAYEPG